ncbi:MAG: serine/threonine-protein kinase, partial [Gemmatimonadales bacterium]
MESEEQHEVNLRAQLQSALGASFEILELIGQGGMATVYRARQPHPSREVAIKVLDPDITTRLIRQRFVREIEVISTLNHPHIVPIYEAGERNELLYYVMPFIDTYTLRQRLTSEGSLGIDETVRMALELADALAYAHDRNVIHRDIKPDNVLLSGGHAIISDFGIARAVECAECATEDVDDVLTAVGRPLGTPLYMSPEQAAGSADLDHRADIYSLGCVVYEMLAGSPPYPGSTPHEIMMKHTVDPVPRVHGLSETIPSHVKSAIRRAMSKDPAARFDDAREFAAALAPRESGRFQVVGQLATRKRPVVMAVAAVVTAVIALPIGMKLMLSSALPELVSDRIAVVALQSSPPGGSSSVGVMASDWVARSLEQTRLLDVVRVGVDGPGNTPRETAVWLQAGLTLTGTYSLNGDSLTLGYDLIDHLSGNRYGTGELLVNGSDPTLAAVSLQRAVFEVLAEEVEPLLAHWTRSSSWPPEPEIYRGYIDARACWVNSDYECALAEVTAVSAEFPAAALLLARTHFELGDWELALRVISGIDDRDSTLTPVELNRLAFLQARLEGDPQGA